MIVFSLTITSISNQHSNSIANLFKLFLFSITTTISTTISTTTGGQFATETKTATAIVRTKIDASGRPLMDSDGNPVIVVNDEKDLGLDEDEQRQLEQRLHNTTRRMSTKREQRHEQQRQQRHQQSFPFSPLISESPRSMSTAIVPRRAVDQDEQNNIDPRERTVSKSKRRRERCIA